MTGTRIDLAHEPDFEIGPLAVRPSTRELARDGETTIIEPRVMQVLVALHRAQGAVVSKDDLVLWCWEGRVVGEDAINRVMSRLRKLTDGAAAGAFRIETVTKVGYRMIAPGGPDARATPATITPRFDRRTAIGGMGATAVAVAAGGWWWASKRSGALPPEVESLVERAQDAINYGTPEQTAVGISLLQRATELAPSLSGPWGKLALAYGQQAQQSSRDENRQFGARSESAAKRAIDLDPNNADAQIALWFWKSGPRKRSEYDRECQAMLSRFPDHPILNAAYAFFMAQAGRGRTALIHMERAIAHQPPAPPTDHAHAMMLWTAGRLDEAYKAMDEAFRLWPRHYGVWFSRYKLLAYTGRASAALAMIEDEANRPTGVPDSNFALCMSEARALGTRTSGDIAYAMAEHWKAARIGVGFAQNAMMFAAATERLDDAFRLARGYYFNEGLQLGDQRFTREQALFSPGRRRATYFFFFPSSKAIWNDPRFAALMEELDLEEYWRETGIPPDFRT